MLVTEWNCNTICFAPIIGKPWYGNVSKAIGDFIAEVEVTGHKTNVIKDEQLDIWIRDYAPLQLTDGTFIQYKFNPPYAPYSYNKWVDAAIKTHLPSQKSLPLVLDGGNFIHNGKTAICTDRIYTDNLHSFEYKRIESLILEAFELETLVTFPVIEGDKTGHIDGMMQFVSEDILLVTDDMDYDLVSKKLPKLNILRCPSVDCGYGIDGFLSAVGCYINFLQTKNGFFVPQFSLSEDDKALKFFEQFGKLVVPIQCAMLGIHGGGLHCITAGYL